MWKVVGSNPDEVIAFFNLPNPFQQTLLRKRLP
jgi:hypothetical protein